jgi:hypothetical protein
MKGSVPACAWTRNWEEGTPWFVVRKAGVSEVSDRRFFDTVAHTQEALEIRVEVRDLVGCNEREDGPGRNCALEEFPGDAINTEQI